jgi:hypothetical protein
VGCSSPAKRPTKGSAAAATAHQSSEPLRARETVRTHVDSGGMQRTEGWGLVHGNKDWDRETRDGIDLEPMFGQWEREKRTGLELEKGKEATISQRSYSNRRAGLYAPRLRNLPHRPTVAVAIGGSLPPRGLPRPLLTWLRRPPEE